MPRRKKTLNPSATEHVRTDKDWIIRTDLTVNGRNVSPGVEVKIAGQGGTRFAFRRHVTNPANGAEWVDVFGGSKGAECVRSFRPDQITTVHRLVKRRQK